jgi:NADH:ubiquinone oxidoreductase subunit K
MVICLLTVYSEFHNSVIGHIFILFIISILAGETAVALSLYALLNRVNKINSENVIF